MIAEIDSDAHRDIIVGLKDTYRQMVAILDGRTGAVEQTFRTGHDVCGTALVEDIDGDGKVEIVIVDESGTLHVIPGRVR